MHLMRKTVIMSFEGKASRKLAKLDSILIILKKENGPWASSAPALGLNTIIFKYVYWYMQQISGERLHSVPFQFFWEWGRGPLNWENRR